MKKKTYILGVGSQAKLIYNLLKYDKKSKYKISGFIFIPNRFNKTKLPKKFCSLNVYKINNIPKKSEIFLGIGDNILRGKIYNSLKNDFLFPKYVSSKSLVRNNVKIGDGTIILDGCIINFDSNISYNCLINTGCIIEHDVNIGSNSNISPAAVVCGNTVIEENCFIGAGTIVQDKLIIKKNSVVGSASNITKNIPANSYVYGNPARERKK